MERCRCDTWQRAFAFRMPRLKPLKHLIMPYNSGEGEGWGEEVSVLYAQSAAVTTTPNYDIKNNSRIMDFDTVHLLGLVHV